jgi:hypothetical protein
MLLATCSLINYLEYNQMIKQISNGLVYVLNDDLMQVTTIRSGDGE